MLKNVAMLAILNGMIKMNCECSVICHIKIR